MKRLIPLILVLFLGIRLFAQGGNFNITVRNLVQTADNKLEFDVFLINTDAGTPFELASCQLGFILNAGIFNGGSLSAAIDNSTSGLTPAQQFSATPGVFTGLAGYPGKAIIKLAGRTPPSAGNGTIISTSGSGTLVTHFTLTATVDFASNTTADISFTPSTAVNPSYPTRVNQYVGTVNTSLEVTPGVNAIVYGNPVLNSTVGIEKAAADGLLRIFPNPATDKVTIEIEGIRELLSYEIISSSGVSLMKGSFSERTTLDISELPRGYYLVKLGDGRSFVRKELVKK
jgi:hypothetical protein